MILIIASELDVGARRAVTEWPNGDALLLTPRDLCSQGWRIEAGRPKVGRFVASGKVIAWQDISGVLTLLPFVPENELVVIESEDRAYVSAELTALLFYVLTTLRCPVVNHPTATNLCGPDWRHQQWIRACRNVGLAIAPSSARLPIHLGPPEPGACSQSLAVIGDVVIGAEKGSLRSKVLQLARSAGVAFLQASFVEQDGIESIHSVQLTPNLGDKGLLTAFHDYFAHA